MATVGVGLQQMKFKKYKCIDCDFTCMIEIVENGAYTLPFQASEHVGLTNHNGFEPTEDENSR